MVPDGWCWQLTCCDPGMCYPANTLPCRIICDLSSHDPNIITENIPGYNGLGRKFSRHSTCWYRTVCWPQVFSIQFITSIVGNVLLCYSQFNLNIFLLYLLLNYAKCINYNCGRILTIFSISVVFTCCSQAYE